MDCLNQNQQMEAIVETNMLVFNNEKYEKDKQFNENSNLDLPIEKEFYKVPLSILLSEIMSFCPDYSGEDDLDFTKSKNYTNRTFVYFKNGDSKSIGMSYEIFKEEFRKYHNSKDEVSFNIPMNNIKNPPNEKDICIMTIRCEDETKTQREIDYDNIFKTK